MEELERISAKSTRRKLRRSMLKSLRVVLVQEALAGARLDGLAPQIGTHSSPRRGPSRAVAVAARAAGHHHGLADILGITPAEALRPTLPRLFTPRVLPLWQMFASETLSVLDLRATSKSSVKSRSCK